MTQKLPVGILLRVSTMMQVNTQQNNEPDLPTQREACMRFIEQHSDWEFEKEYLELGVSGFNVPVHQREKLSEIRDDICSGKIKVLLVFMFDRLGRRNELALLAQSFANEGCEVWSAVEGQMKFDGHIDELLNFITFWSAGGESKKTSTRVSNAMTVMAQQGLYTGGKVPYGYKAVPTGRLTKKQLPEKTLVINEKEAAVVRRMFDLALNSGYGCHRIARTLNEAGFRNRNGNQWSHTSISNYLSNPIYKGLKAYNRTTGKGLGKRQKRLPPEQWTLANEVNPDWIIVSAEDWDAVNRQKQAAVERQKKQQAHNKSLPDTVISRSKLLFGGFAFCGVCGAKMSTGYSPYRWKTADGVTHRKDNPVYRCGSKSSGKIGCTAKSSYQKKKVEDAVLTELRNYFDRLKQVELSADITSLQEKNTETEEEIIKSLKKDINKVQNEYQGLEEEIIRVISGESSLPRDTLSEMLEKKKMQVDELTADLHSAEELLEKKKIEQGDLEALREVIPVWSEVFDNATVDEQKVMLSRVIERVDIFPDNIKVHLRLHVKEFIGLFEKNLAGQGKKRVSKLTRNSIDRVGDKDVLGTFSLIAKVHQNLVFDTSGSIGGKSRPFAVVKGGRSFDETDGADGD